MYKPHYLNVTREVKEVVAGNKVYWRTVSTSYFGRKKNVVAKINKSQRRFL